MLLLRHAIFPASFSRSARLTSMSCRRVHSDSEPCKNFKILREELNYSRYLSVYNRVVEAQRQFPSIFCAVIPFNTNTKLVTLIKEYAQGANDLMYSLPCGGLSKSHSSLEDCAMKELSEEAHLHNGKLVKLIADDHPGLLEVKWCRNRFTPFLILDPEVDPNPRPRDKEEFMEVLQVDLRKLKEIMYNGQMMLPSIVTCTMGLKYLEEHKLI